MPKFLSKGYTTQLAHARAELTAFETHLRVGDRDLALLNLQRTYKAMAIMEGWINASIEAEH